MDLSLDASTKAALPAALGDPPCALAEAMRRAVFDCAMPVDPTHVAAVVIDVRIWARWQAISREYLSERDQRQVARLRRADEQQWRCMGYALLRLWLSCVTGVPVAQVSVERNGDGRPQLADALGDVSLSHAGPWFAFAWSARERVGVDLESCERVVAMDGLEAYVCHPQELATVAGGSTPGQADLLRLWTRKEAALKRAGLGLSLEPQTFMAPSGTPFSLPGVAGAVEISEFASGAPVFLAVAHAPGVRASAYWLQP